MKFIKNLPLMALVLGLGLAFATSAFTSSAKSNTSKQQTYWFLMDASGTNITTTQVSNPNLLCPTKVTPNCARQYNQSQTQIVGGVRQVKPTEVNSQIDFRSKN